MREQNRRGAPQRLRVDEREGSPASRPQALPGVRERRGTRGNPADRGPGGSRQIPRGKGVAGRAPALRPRAPVARRVALFQIFSPDIYNRAINSSLYKLYNFMESDYGMVYRTAIEVWLNNPIVGGGLHQFKNLYPYYNIEIWKNMVITHAHNYPLSLLAETGIIGLTLFYIIIISLFKRVLDSFYIHKNLLKLFITANLLYICFFPSRFYN